LRQAEKEHSIEAVGEKLRAMMSWIPNEKKKAEAAGKPAGQVVNA
jgi:ketol-acid reductoisomerase